MRLSAIALVALLASAGAVAQTAPATPTAPAPTTPKPHPLKPGQFATEDEAKAHCPSDTVVKTSRRGKAYHLPGSAAGDKLKHPVFECQKDADAAGLHLAKGETPPAAH